MTTLIKDLIRIPEVVHKGDYVLKLTEGVRETRRDGRQLRRHGSVGAVL